MPDAPVTNRTDPALDEQKRRRRRSLAIALSLAALAILFYALTIAKLGPQLFNRPM